MSSYEFVSIWNVDGPIDRVWEIIKDSKTWPEWWRGVLRVVELKAGDADGRGAVHRSTWKSALPYSLEFDSEVVRIETNRLIEAQATGELEGIGIWQFFDEGPGVRVRYDWKVDTNKQWMNAIAPVARPFFRWNHNVIMRWGETGLRQRLARLGQFARAEKK
jgi:hypothetical protein